MVYSTPFTVILGASFCFNCFRLSKTDGLFPAICSSVGHPSICPQSAQVSSPFSRTQLCTGQSLSQKGVLAPSVRHPVQLIMSGRIVIPIALCPQGGGFFPQGDVVCDCCDSGIAFFTVQSTAADHLVCVFQSYLHKISIHISVAISTALHGEPSAPDRFRGAAFRK